MNMTRRAALLTFLIAASAAAMFGQTRSDYEAVLFPLAVENVPGAYGSLWTSEAFVLNPTNETVFVPAFQGVCRIAPCLDGFGRGANAIDIVHSTGRGPTSPPAFVLYVPRVSVAVLQPHLRIRDVSRQSQTWGTEIPVVYEREFTHGPIVLGPIPLDERFRASLRVYDIDGRYAMDDTAARVNIRLFDDDLRTLYSVVTDVPASASSLDTFGQTPGYFQLLDIAAALRAVSDISALSHVNVEVRPVSPGLRIWAFVSITHDETQHVTTITPQAP